MPSSTSSSKLRFSVTVFAVGVFFFVGYILLAPVLFPKGGLPQSQWQGNIMDGQRYLYDIKEPRYVIVGTSLTKRITQGNEFFRMAFDGGSIYDGLQIIMRSKKYPKVLLIEVNYPQRRSDGKMISSLFTPVFYDLRRVFPGLREAYQPIALANEYFKRRFEPIMQQLQSGSNGFLASPLRSSYSFMVADAYADERLAGKKPVDVKKQVIASDTDVVKKDAFLSERIRAYSTLPQGHEVEEITNELSKMVPALQREDIKIIFFEMPRHPEISNSPRSNFVRERLFKVFPPDVYTWIPMPDPREFQTTDGSHLNPQSAQKMTDYLQTQAIALSVAK